MARPTQAQKLQRYLDAIARMTVACEAFVGSIANVAVAARGLASNEQADTYARLAFEQCQAAIRRACKLAPQVAQLFQLPAEPASSTASPEV